MAHAFSSEAQIALAAGVALAACACALLLLATIIVMRSWRRLRHWGLAKQEQAWRRAMQEAMDDPGAGALPPISRIDLPDFLMMWNRLQETLRGKAADNMGELLRRHGLAERALRLLRHGSLRSRLIAMTSLGHLRDERAWPVLEVLSRDSGTVVSFAAARALLRIEPRRALDALSPSIIHRDDWSIARLGCIFAELGPALVTPTLTTMLIARPRKGLDRVVKLAKFGERSRVAPIVRGWLSASDDMDVIVAALDYVEDIQELPWVKGASGHAEWRVRMSAAKALGRVGSASELSTLLELLQDSVWWVRYHAAQALTKLHGMTPEELKIIREKARDHFAADMLAHALAEMPRRNNRL